MFKRHLKTNMLTHIRQMTYHIGKVVRFKSKFYTYAFYTSLGDQGQKQSYTLWQFYWQQNHSPYMRNHGRTVLCSKSIKNYFYWDHNNMFLLKLSCSHSIVPCFNDMTLSLIFLHLFAKVIKISLLNNKQDDSRKPMF